jgi:hypothetical protein
MLCLALLAGTAAAKEYFVDAKHTAASDRNAGTEGQPLKTIQTAVDLAKPGDMIWVKAGTYEEPVKIRTAGTLNQPITISAWKDERVCVGSVPRDLPPADKWQAVPNRKSWSVQLPEGTAHDLVVILDGKPIVTQLKDTPPDDKEEMWATYRKSDRTLMVLTDGKANPAAAHKLQLARQFDAFILPEQASFWNFKKLEVAWVTDGFVLCGAGYLVEDCYFHNTYRGAFFPLGRLITIRRCNFHKCGYCIAASGSGPANIVEDNLMVDCGQDEYEDILHHSIHLKGENLSPTTFKGAAFAQIFRYNIIADTKGGLWYDGGETGCRVIGNCFWDIRHGQGIYNEYCANDTMVLGNYFLHSSVSSSWCTRLSIFENFFDGGAVVWHCRLLWPLRNSFMSMRGNALVDPPGGYLQHYGFGWGKSPYPEGFSNCWADYNRSRIRPEYPVLNDAGTKYKTLAEVRARFGWELHGDCKPYDPDHNDLTPESMGGSTATFRLPWGPKTFLARPMLSDAAINGTFPAAAEMAMTFSAPSFFWRVADGNYGDLTLFNGNRHEHENRWRPNSNAGYGQGENNGARWFIDAEKKSAEKLDPKEISPEMSNGNHWLHMEGVSPQKMPAEGVGYWSPPLAAIEGAKITVSLRMMGQAIQPTERGAPAVWLQFTDETGQNRQRAFLVGKGDDGTVVREKLTKGSYGWTEVKDTITAPKGAIRMALFLGVLPCKGVVCFDDIEIKTATAASPAALAEAEALPPRLPLERIKAVFPVDLSKVANRGLADDEAGDGRGGWSDQGPAADMRALKTGKVKFGGVPFEITAEPRSAVVLKSPHRLPGRLPDRVTIPVGRKLDTLFFLHAAASAVQGGDLNFLYDLHYKDKKVVRLYVTGNNLANWIADPVKRFSKEEQTVTTAAVTVPVPQFGQGTVYRMEWNAPSDRRTVELESIEFIGGGRAVPILLGITGVTEW